MFVRNFRLCECSGRGRPEDALVRLSCRKDCERLRLRGDELANDGNILVDGIEELRAEANGDGRKPQDGACSKKHSGDMMQCSDGVCTNVSMWRSIARLAFEEHGKRKQGDAS